MTTYTATFSNGQSKTLANSKREYQAAWMIEYTSQTGAVGYRIGFAATREMAVKAANSEFAMMVRTPRHMKARPPWYTLNRTEVVDL